MSKRDILDDTEHRYASFQGPVLVVRHDDWNALREEVARLRRKHHRESNHGGPIGWHPQFRCGCKDCDWVRAENRKKRQERKVRKLEKEG